MTAQPQADERRSSSNPSLDHLVLDLEAMGVRGEAPEGAGAPSGGSVRARPVGRGHGPAWVGGYVRSLLVGDTLAVGASVLLAYLLRFHFVEATSPALSSIVVALVLVPLWIGVLAFFRAYEPRFLGVGSEEYDRVLRAALLVLAVVATTSWALKLDVARGFVVIALPTAMLLTLAWRYAARQRLHHQRAHGKRQQSVLVGGHLAGVLAMLGHMARSTHHGMVITAVCLPRPRGAAGHAAPQTPLELQRLGIEVVGYLDEVAAAAAEHDVDAVAVLPSPELDGPALRSLGWDLESTRAELLVAPAITEVIGPRVAIRPVCGVPLMHLHRPEHTGGRQLAKSVVDRCAAAAGLLVLSPVLVAIAIAIRLDSPGPALFRQERVGKHGERFTMFKFRSMSDRADEKVIDLRDGADAGNGMLFKMRVDPRVTRVGKVLRAYSLDELPQLINVLFGSMSLVGPRPPLQREVDRYGYDVHRRLLVKPGLTGLWQVNGRSDLSWDESVRLDLRYVENWSFAFDFMILWKTARAVLARSGAY